MSCAGVGNPIATAVNPPVKANNGAQASWKLVARISARILQLGAKFIF